jgi:hypothetical protein
MREIGGLAPSGPVSPAVVKRQRMTSMWFYEFCAKCGVDGPEDATLEQEAEYNRGLKAIYARFETAESIERKRACQEWLREFCAKYGVRDPLYATAEQEAEYERGIDEIYGRIPDKSQVW